MPYRLVKYDCHNLSDLPEYKVIGFFYEIDIARKVAQMFFQDVYGRTSYSPPYLVESLCDFFNIKESSSSNEDLFAITVIDINEKTIEEQLDEWWELEQSLIIYPHWKIEEVDLNSFDKNGNDDTDFEVMEIIIPTWAIEGDYLMLSMDER